MKTDQLKRTLIGVLLCSQLTACLQTGTTPAAQRDTVVYGNDFNRTVKGPFGSVQLDEDCTQPFDSANPFVMAVEMYAVLETPQMFDTLNKKLGLPPDTSAQQRKRQKELLQETARHKIWLPVSAETWVGQQLHESLEQQRSLVPEEQLHPRERARLAQIRQWVILLVQALPANQPYSFGVHVYRERTSTVAAQMGGFIYVSEGLLRDRSLQDADLALRLSHEIAHVTKRHVLRDFQTKAVDALTVANFARQDLKKLNDGPVMLNAVQKRYARYKLLTRSFDHGNELEADSCAVRLLKQVLPPEAIRQAVSNFEQQNHTSMNTPNDEATHPRSEKRTRIMYRQLAQ